MILHARPQRKGGGERERERELNASYRGNSMASGHHNQKGVPESLRKQLAVAVRSIQWSYAIFWSISSRQPGVLEWGDGYYNGDIKTRKTVQAVEFNAHQLGLQRSEQLRELYESLSEGESSPQTKRPSAALSPEDLTDPEWYYLVCMSFVFNIGQGLPGRTLANGQPIWLCNAHYADSKVFCRSLLAKSASIQTVVCFPFLGGVVELGVTELVLEDPSFIQHIKTSFLEIPHLIVSNISRSVSGNARNDDDLIHADKLDEDIIDTHLNAIVGCEEEKVCSPDDSSNWFGLNQAEESFVVEGLNEGASQVQSLQLVDDEVSNCLHNSTSSSDCISQTLIEKRGKENDSCHLRDLKEQNQAKLTTMGLLQADDIHYQGVLSTLMKSSHQLILGPCLTNSRKESSFVSWKRGGGFTNIQMPRNGTPQRLLKKVLFDSREYDGRRRDGLWRPQVDEIDSNRVLAERRRREKINERFSVLGSLVPSSSKVDKVSVLDKTIEYLKELEKRVEELASCGGKVAELEGRTRRKARDTVERTSDNYRNNNNNNSIGKCKKPSINKRKAVEIDEVDSTDNVSVSMIEKDVSVEIRCPWRECLLLQIMDTISRLHLECHSVQSTNSDGILSLTIKSKLRRTTDASAASIKKALQRVVQKS